MEWEWLKIKKMRERTYRKTIDKRMIKKQTHYNNAVHQKGDDVSVIFFKYKGKHALKWRYVVKGK